MSRAYPSALDQPAHEVLTLHKPDASIAEVRNELGEEASGEWLCFLDADDELSPGFLQKMEVAWVRISGHNKIKHPLLTPQVSYVQENGRRHAPKHHRRGNLQNDNYLVVGTLVQRDLFLQVGGFEDYPHGFEDWSLWAKCEKAGAQVVQVMGAIYIAYLNPDSKHRIAWADRKMQMEMHHRIRRELFPELYPKNAS